MDRAPQERPQPIIHSLHGERVSIMVFMLIFIVAAALGIGTGFSVSKVQKSSGPLTIEGAKTEGKTVGVVDKKRFPDTAEGVMKEGGIEGEGNFHLERAGGESQNVYLTSSVVDLSEFIGKKVKVGGQTFQGEKAGWLMDVGYVEVK